MGRRFLSLEKLPNIGILHSTFAVCQTLGPLLSLYTISYFQICNLSDILFNLLCKLTGLNCQSRAFQSRASSELWRVKGKYNILHSNIKRSIIYNKLEMVKQTFRLNIAFHGQVMTILQKRLHR